VLGVGYLGIGCAVLISFEDLFKSASRFFMNIAKKAEPQLVCLSRLACRIVSLVATRCYL
jgi:hypothetical protein